MRGTHLVGPQHRLQHEHILTHPQHPQLLFLPQAHLDDGGEIGLLEGAPEQYVRLQGPLVGLEQIGLVEADRVDLAGRHELHHLDVLGGGHRQAGEVLVGEHDGRAVGHLVRLGDLSQLQHLAAFPAHAVVLHPAVVDGMHLMEAHVMVLGRCVGLHRHGHQPEGDGALPNRTHAPSMAVRADLRQMSSDVKTARLAIRPRPNVGSYCVCHRRPGRGTPGAADQSDQGDVPETRGDQEPGGRLLRHGRAGGDRPNGGTAGDPHPVPARCGGAVVLREERPRWHARVDPADGGQLHPLPGVRRSCRRGVVGAEQRAGTAHPAMAGAWHGRPPGRRPRSGTGCRPPAVLRRGGARRGLPRR